MASEEYPTEFSGDESSYEIIEWKEFYFSTESDSGYSSGEGNLQKKKEDDSAYDDQDYDEYDEESSFCKNLRQRGISIKPREIVDIGEMVKEAVLPYIPAKALTRFKLVSKEWELWINHPFLAHKQSYCFQGLSGYFCQREDESPTFQGVDPEIHGVPCEKVSFLPEEVTVKGSSNGLLLCQSVHTYEAVYFVCNPATTEWQNVPPSNLYHGSSPEMVLAFEPSELNFNANFNIICASVLTGTSAVGFEVYSSETGTWTCSEAYCFELEDGEEHEIVLGDGFYMKGMVYWQISTGNILAFDMKSDTYGILPLSAPLDGILTQMNGELCYIRAHFLDGKTCGIDIYGGMNMTLKRSIELSMKGESDGECRVLACADDGKIMLIRMGEVVNSCNLETHEAKLFSRSVSSDAKYFPYVNSLASIWPY